MAITVSTAMRPTTKVTTLRSSDAHRQRALAVPLVGQAGGLGEHAPGATGLAGAPGVATGRW